MMRLAAAIGALLLGASPAAATGFQTVFDFEDQTLGATGLSLGSTPISFASGGTIATSAGAHSGTKVYRGTTLDFVVEDEIAYDWPAMAAYVTGADAVTLTGWHYNPDTAIEDFAGSASIAAGSADSLLSIGSEGLPVSVTRWQFASASAFTLDDLTVGWRAPPAASPNRRRGRC